MNAVYALSPDGVAKHEIVQVSRGLSDREQATLRIDALEQNLRDTSTAAQRTIEPIR